MLREGQRISKRGGSRYLEAKQTTDETREHRIDMEIVVDADDEQERTMGRYYYLEGKLTFPFLARCVGRRAISS
jgi:hypothetical protein